ncbi:MULTISPECIES: hypothetical protein [unclassified Devosia]|uniref:hypothetical protein n=1 Tax=unclassified Devosia TaxID=196773 RepID=UPI00086D16BC|nr:MULTISPECIES: hypothetical protein [unclassified Devosia]MBN9363092.1 hypothetical protein [Devosia sp.]ODS87373.1 MAG: hypothetical protein ABS47_12060 [Devosia sp. SCN 66-27]OJV50105.1 MAG: hypothetical protein BGO36_06075 [Burkholderiales bacterium 68-10]OJX23409.1 MAG: hypothetical protein BGO83_00560 [Devosia sp. 66-14]
MPERSNDIWNEVASAARGVAALVIGDRRAASYFDFSDRGLVGSFIAFLVVALINTGVPLILGIPGMSGTVFRAIATVVIVLALQIGAAAIVLRQLKRSDALVPYIVADNWATFFLTIATTALGLTGIGGELLLVVTGIVIIIVMVNLARLILTLTAWQIVTFLVAQLISGIVALMVLTVVFPLSADQLAELGAAAASSRP